MNLSELKTAVDRAIESAIEYGSAPDDITVSIQVDINKSSAWSNDVELVYDNDCQASGCVIVGDANDAPSQQGVQADAEERPCSDCAYPPKLRRCGRL